MNGSRTGAWGGLVEVLGCNNCARTVRTPDWYRRLHLSRDRCRHGEFSLKNVFVRTQERAGNGAKCCSTAVATLVLASFPGLRGGEGKAWYALFAHARNYYESPTRFAEDKRGNYAEIEVDVHRNVITTHVEFL